MFLYDYNTFANTLQQCGYKVIPNGMRYDALKNDLYVTITRKRIIVRQYKNGDFVNNAIYRFTFNEDDLIFIRDQLINQIYAEELFYNLNSFDQLPMKMNMLEIKNALEKM